MTLLYLILICGLAAFVMLISYTARKKAYAVLALSLGLIAVIVFLTVAAYQVQMGYDHMHMTRILKVTADAIRAGQSDAVVIAYDQFSAMRTNVDVRFWDARNQLYEDLTKLGTTTKSIQVEGKLNHP